MQIGHPNELSHEGVGVHAPPMDLSVEVWVLEPLHVDEPKTNNAAEVVVLIKALRLLESMACKVCVPTDSEYVLLGATGKAPKWRSYRWVGSRGPLSNVSLWVEGWICWPACRTGCGG